MQCHMPREKVHVGGDIKGTSHIRPLNVKARQLRNYINQRCYKPMQLFLACPAINDTSCARSMEAFDVISSGIPRVQDVSSFTPLGAHKII